MSATLNSHDCGVEGLPTVIKYPRTEHLFDTGGTATTSDDLVLKDLDATYRAFCGSPIIVEEKVDGANMGFRLSDDGQILIQNRSRYVSSGDHAQFSRIQEWVAQHREALQSILASGKVILYGEWCAAKHSIPYHKLPGYFVAFDLYDCSEQKFYSRRRFHKVLQSSGIPVVPTICIETFSTSTSARGKKNRSRQGTVGVSKVDFVKRITELLESPSAFRKDGGTVEGVVLRQDGPDWMLRRFKVVRPDFIGGCADGHWTRRPIEKQVVDFTFAESYLDECYVLAQERKVASLEISRHTDKLPSKRSSRQAKQETQIQRRRRRRVPRCIMLMGLPASGKSTFAQALSHALNQDPGSICLVANQDELGRKECFREAGKASRRKSVIVDRCNLLEKERKEWLDAMHSPNFGEIALIHFAASSDICKVRVQQRSNHPSIPQGKGARIVEQLAAKMEPPTEYERKHVFGLIETVNTFEDSCALLKKWGVPEDFLPRKQADQ